MDNSEINKILANAVSIKPNNLIISDLKWKYLVRGVLRAKNVMVVGPSGCAKTMAAKCVADAFVEEKEEVITEERLNLLKNNPNIKIEKIEKV